jgi:hypothetical protein
MSAGDIAYSTELMRYAFSFFGDVLDYAAKLPPDKLLGPHV